MTHPLQASGAMRSGLARPRCGRLLAVSQLVPALCPACLWVMKLHVMMHSCNLTKSCSVHWSTLISPITEPKLCKSHSCEGSPTTVCLSLSPMQNLTKAVLERHLQKSGTLLSLTVEPSSRCQLCHPKPRLLKPHPPNMWKQEWTGHRAHQLLSHEVEGCCIC